MTDNQSIAELEKEANAINQRLRKAREAEHEKNTLSEFRDRVGDHEKQHDDLIERQTSYDTDSKARLFGFGAFTGQDGALLWVIAGSIYAVEKSPNETFTMLKTASEPIGVTESPDEVFNELTRIRFEGSAESVREAQAELTRREEKVREAEASGDEKAQSSPSSTPSGPDFQSVSDSVSFDGELEDDEDAF